MRNGETQHIYKHNRLIGCACMIRSQAMAVVMSASATKEAKALADQITTLSLALEAEIRARRVNLDKTITTLETKS